MGCSATVDLMVNAKLGVIAPFSGRALRTLFRRFYLTLL